MSTTAPSYRIIDHTADLGIIVRGPDVGGLFISAARAMIDLMVKGDLGDKRTLREVSVSSEDYPDLMVRWLGEVLYLFAGDKLIVDSIEIKELHPTQIKATLSVADFEPKRHRVLREIKAVTYHGISVRKTNGAWEARIIFDI
ncbi:MAG: archease [Deltaproteobacteria bacterium]|nr:archease [Deltaproteobacteria bacterium]